MKSATSTDTAKHPHWYRRFVGECPVCGRDAGYRERVYGKKPTDPRKIWRHLPAEQTYDHCDQ